MKKILSIFATMVLTLSMAAVSVYAAEADTDVTSAQAACTHPGVTNVEKEYQTPVAINDELHEIRVIAYHYCANCGGFRFYVGPYVERTAEQRFGPETYTSNHSGNYTEHYYTYTKVCKDCGRAIERTGKTGCTAKLCIEPQ